MCEWKKIIYASGITAAVFLILKYLLPYVVPFLLAYILVHILNPVTEFIRRKTAWKKEVIAGILLVILLTVLSVFFYWIYGILMRQLKNIVSNLEFYSVCFYDWLDRCCSLAERNLGLEGQAIKNVVYDGMNQAADRIQIYLVPNVVNYSVRYLKKMFDAGIFLLMLFVAVILLMKDYDEMKEKLQKYQWYQHFHTVTGRMWKKGGAYMKAQLMIIGVVTVLCTIGLWALGNPYFLLLGIVIGLTDALPFIGTGTVLLPVTLYFVLGGRFRLAAGYGGLFLLTYIVREFMEPRVLGEKLGIYPFVMVTVVYAGLYLYGVSGVFLGPATLLLVQEIMREIEYTGKCSENRIE